MLKISFDIPSSLRIQLSHHLGFVLDFQAKNMKNESAHKLKDGTFLTDTHLLFPQ